MAWGASYQNPTRIGKCAGRKQQRDAFDDRFDGVDLIPQHHHQFLLAGDDDDVAADHLGERTLGEERVVGELDVVERLEFPAEIFLQRVAVPDVRAVFVLQVAKRLDKLLFKLAFGRSHWVIPSA